LTKGLWRSQQRSVSATFVKYSGARFIFHETANWQIKNAIRAGVTSLGTKQRAARGACHLTGSYADDEKLHPPIKKHQQHLICSSFPISI